MTPDEPRFESLLRDGLSRPDLPDGGFAGRVMATLRPAPPLSYYRAYIVLGWLGAASGAAVALWACIPWSELGASQAPLGQTPSGLPAFAWATFALTMALAGGGAAWYLRESATES